LFGDWSHSKAAGRRDVTDNDIHAVAFDEVAEFSYYCVRAPRLIDNLRLDRRATKALVQKALSSFPLGGTEFGEKLQSYAEKNIAATNEYVRKLSEAKDLQEVSRIQTEFIQTQFNVLGEQTKSLAETFTKASTEAVKTPFQKS
jgi:hypothetical protein